MHDRLDSRADANALWTWIRHAISSAPLESLCVSCVTKEDPPVSSINFDRLVSYLGEKHASTLRFLYLQRSFVGADGMRHLCKSCVNLEELHVMTNQDGVVCLCLDAFSGQ